jgi:hypothetical protein
LLHSVPERSLVYYEEGAVLVKAKSDLAAAAGKKDSFNYDI